jgi:hypothetical protein
MTTDTTHLRRRLTDRAQVQQFVLAGKSRFTIVSKQSGARFTFRVTASQNPGSVTHFVSLLTGNDNESAYTYIGQVRANGRFDHGRKSPIAATAASVKALSWFWTVVMEERENAVTTIPAKVEFWHEGRCCRCGRALTVPASIARGIGPECAGKMGVDLDAYQESDEVRFAIEQDERRETLSHVALAIDADERVMQEIEARADRAETIRDEMNKWLARGEMEQRS